MASTKNESRSKPASVNDEEKPVVLTSSSSDDGNNSSGESHGADAKHSLPKVPSSKPNGTKTSYRDFSRVPPDKKEASSSLISQTSTAKEPTFPVKLHMIISNSEFQDIIAWLPHGRSWRILQQKAFEEKVIPLYFRHGRYSSFARQVNGWGFRRITHGSDYNSYYHELFLRGLPHLCEKMRRLTAKDIGQRKKEEDEPAPDFYALSRDHPLPDKTSVLPASAVTSASVATPPVTAGAPGANRTQTAAANNLVDVELAMLEKRRAEIMERINLIASNQGNSDGTTSMNGTAGSMNQPAGPAAASHGQPDLAALQQRIRNDGNNPSSINSAGTSNSFNPAALNIGPNTNLASILAALQGKQDNRPQSALPPASNSNLTTSPAANLPQNQVMSNQQNGISFQGQNNNTNTGSNQINITALLQQAGLAALLQQAGLQQGNQKPQQQLLLPPQQQPNAQIQQQSQAGQQQNGANLLAQLLQQTAYNNQQPAPAPVQVAPQNNNQNNILAQLLGQHFVNQNLQANNPTPNVAISQPVAPAPTSNSLQQGQQHQSVFGGNNISQLLGQNGANDPTSALQRQLLGSRLTSSDIASLLSLNNSLSGGFNSNARQSQQDGGHS